MLDRSLILHEHRLLTAPHTPWRRSHLCPWRHPVDPNASRRARSLSPWHPRAVQARQVYAPDRWPSSHASLQGPCLCRSDSKVWDRIGPSWTGLADPVMRFCYDAYVVTDDKMIDGFGKHHDCHCSTVAPKRVTARIWAISMQHCCSEQEARTPSTLNTAAPKREL